MEEQVEFKDMNNAQLKELCEDFGLVVKAANPAKPNKGELLEALETFKATQDKIHGIDREADKADTTVGASTPKRKPKSLATLQKLELFSKERVVVRDMQETQTKDELISVSWGNRLIGMQTDWVDLSGNPQYVRVGALNNLKDATMSVQEPKPGGGVSMVNKKRFVIVPVEPLTQKELDELANQQRMRNSKYA
jgi:hypothetical protein